MAGVYRREGDSSTGGELIFFIKRFSGIGREIG